MTRRVRRGLFYALLGIFIIAGAGVVFYAQGFRLDITTGKISKIGAIFVRSFPDSADIYLNGKAVQNQSGFLSRGTLISDLFPKNYVLKLSAAGYDDWQENAAVSPSFVAQFKYAVLIPRDATNVATGTVEKFFAGPGRHTVVTENQSGTILVNGVSIGKGDLLDATPDRAGILFRNPDENIYLYESNIGLTVNISGVLQKVGVSSSSVDAITINPNNAGQVMAIASRKIWLITAAPNAQSTATQIEKNTANQIIGPSVADGDSLIAWTRFQNAWNTSNIIFYDKSLGVISKSSTTMLGVNQKLGWIDNVTLGILQGDGSLYLYNTNSQKPEKLADDVKDFTWTEDGSMVAALEHNGVEIFSLDDSGDYYRFNIPNVGSVSQLIWYKDDSHLFVIYPDHIAFLDVADSSLTNFTTVANGTLPAYDPTANSLYFIDPTQKLVRLDFPQ